MARRLRRLKISEISSVDRGAGKGCRVILMKRDDNSGNTMMIEEQPAVNRMTERAEALMRSDPTVRTIESAIGRIAVSRDSADQELWQDYKHAPPPPPIAPEPPPIAKSAAMLQLERKARKLAKREGISQASAFSRIYTDARYADLVTEDKRAHVAKTLSTAR